MKEVNKNSLGFEVPINVYESEAEADQAAGKVGALLDQANANLWYRGAAPEARDAICEVVERETGIKREVKAVMKTEKAADGTETQVQAKDSEGNEKWEFVMKEAPYVEFALEKSGKKVADLQPLVIAHIRTLNGGKGISVDIKEPERKAPQPKKLPGRFLETATKMLAPEGKIEAFAKDYRKLFERDVDRTSAETVGWALKELVDEQARRAGGKYA